MSGRGCFCAECPVHMPDESIESDPIVSVVGGTNVIAIMFCNGDVNEQPQFLSAREARVLARRLLKVSDQVEGT